MVVVHKIVLPIRGTCVRGAGETWDALRPRDVAGLEAAFVPAAVAVASAVRLITILIVILLLIIILLIIRLIY